MGKRSRFGRFGRHCGEISKKKKWANKKGGDDDVVMLLSCFSGREQFLCGGERL